jgi:hypothetical protein
VILDTLDAFGQQAFGNEGGFEPIERALMEDPLARILARSDPAKMGQYAAIMDPLLLGAGLILYASRIQKGQAAKRPAKAAAPPLSQVMRATPEADPSAGAVLRQNLTPIGGIQ